MGSQAGNTRLVYAAKQSAKGSTASAPTHVFRLSGDGGVDPNRSIIQLPETDSSSQRPPSQVVGAEPGGGWQGWLRPSEFAFLAHMIMGSDADSGGGPYTHTATPVAATPYLTLWDVIPGVQCTRFEDARLSQLGCSGQSLAGIQYTCQAIALSATLGATEPVAPAAPATDVQTSYPMVTVSLAAAHPGTIDAFSLLVNRNVSILRGDNGLGAYDSVVGLFDVTGTFSKIYTSDAEYRRMHGGSSGATVLTTTIYSEALALLIAIDGTHSVEFDSSGIEYTETRVPVNVDGTPIIMTQSFNTQRQATWANNLTIVTKNALATSVTTPT